MECLLPGADPEKKEGAELRLDWDRSYLASMKYSLRFKEETDTLLQATN